jgi:hypothetical protein
MGIDAYLSIAYGNEDERQAAVRREGPGAVTKIVDRRQQAVRMAGAAGHAAPRERAPSCGVIPSAPGPERVFHLQTPCSVLERAALLHPPISAVLGCASAAVATEGRAVRSTVGAGGRCRNRGASPHCAAGRSPSWRPPGPIRVGARRGRLASRRTGVTEGLARLPYRCVVCVPTEAAGYRAADSGAARPPSNWPVFEACAQASPRRSGCAAIRAGGSRPAIPAE